MFQRDDTVFDIETGKGQVNVFTQSHDQLNDKKLPFINKHQVKLSELQKHTLFSAGWTCEGRNML